MIMQPVIVANRAHLVYLNCVDTKVVQLPNHSQHLMSSSTITVRSKRNLANAAYRLRKRHSTSLAVSSTTPPSD